MSRAIICWQSPYRPMFDRQSADCTNHQIPKNGDQWKRNYNLRCFNEKIIGRRENQVKHRPTVTRLAKFKPLRPTVCLGNANARLKIHARCANPFFFLFFVVTASENRHEEQLCAEGSLGTDRLIWILDKINLCNILVVARYRNGFDHLCICTF